MGYHGKHKNKFVERRGVRLLEKFRPVIISLGVGVKFTTARSLTFILDILTSHMVQSSLSSHNNAYIGSKNKSLVLHLLEHRLNIVMYVKKQCFSFPFLRSIQSVEDIVLAPMLCLQHP